MIPPTWQECRRPNDDTDDDELVGYLMSAGEQVIPVTLIGTPLGEAQANATAVALLHERGLMTLNGRWWCLLPEVVLGTDTDPLQPQPSWEWRSVFIVEASPQECRVRLEMPAEEERTSTVTLPVPVGELLRARQP
ncbi:hypothetical protein [Deinococcus puniceus]|uniref:Uncharacterized protein n=1 Tax=Deinococcus puniceus TaxID=1182568 RepID=A0A172T7J1_9DEIO|nr:hypothetical protein [Deinococcus puniceus]ANE42922.1 hypothetical protein SU48_03120 [Deinococcus puniceus]